MAHASVLGYSIAVTHPGARLTVFLLDGPPANSVGLEHVDLVQAEQLMPAAEWHHRQCFYDVLELATSIKPACFVYILRDSCDFAIYLDPDILVLKPLEIVFSAFAAGYEIVLTPHLLTPLPDDGKQPDDLAILRAGVYNLGFAAFANTEPCQTILQWWGHHLHTLCLADPSTGTFTDQKWANFIPTFVPMTFVVRHPGYNVAYWNLHERTVRQSDDRWRVLFTDGTEQDGVFFHFSGYSPATRPISKHENRFQENPPGDTRRLLTHYTAALTAADFGRFAKHPLPAPRFEEGMSWDPVCRMLYRIALRENPNFSDPLEGSSFLLYASGKDVGDHLPRYLRALMQLSPEVAIAYDDARDLSDLMRWLLSNGHREVGIDPKLLQRLNLGTPNAVGVNYVGYLRSHLGIGEAARNAISALRSAGLEVATHDISDSAASPRGDYGIDLDATSLARSWHAITILGFNADQTPSVLMAEAAHLRATFLVGYWAWETPDFPEQWRDRFDLVDEVWVASRFVADAVRAKSTVPVTVVPYMVAPPNIKADRAWVSSRKPEIEQQEFIFLFLFDIASVPFRKNPEGAINAFIAAFRPDEPVHLIVKSLNSDRDPGLLERLAEMAKGHRITFWEEPLETLDRFRLLASVDALVSLHRAEGFGISIAEAMAYGLPVVTTDWSGNTDFTNEWNAVLVDYDLVATDRQHGPYPIGTLWAEPRLDDAARKMRRVWNDATWRRSVGAAAAKTIASQYSPETIGAIMKLRIEHLSGYLRTARQKRLLTRPRQPATGARLEGLSQGSAAALVFGDLMRQPLFYLLRAPRLPRLLLTEGFGPSLRRAAIFVRNRNAASVRPFGFRSLVLGISRFLRRLGVVRGGTIDREKERVMKFQDAHVTRNNPKGR